MNQKTNLTIFNFEFKKLKFIIESNLKINDYGIE